jgi:hypothetical protein
MSSNTEYMAELQERVRYGLRLMELQLDGRPTEDSNRDHAWWQGFLSARSQRTLDYMWERPYSDSRWRRAWLSGAVIGRKVGELDDRIAKLEAQLAGFLATSPGPAWQG